MTDIAHLYERFNSDLPVNHPVSRYSYLVLNPVELWPISLNVEQMSEEQIAKATAHSLGPLVAQGP